MKKVVVAMSAFLLAALCACATSNRGECASCYEYTQLNGWCPYCLSSICSSCLEDIEYEIDCDREHNYENGYENGYEDGHEDGYEEAREEWYLEGYSDGYGELEEELNFWQNSAVIVTTTGEKYHAYGCYHIEDRRYWIYNIELAQYKGYTACLDCIDW